jgi:hypothetical protein
VDVAQLGVHHRAEDAAAPMRRLDADGGDSSARQRAAGNRELEWEGTGAADDLAVLESGVHPLVRQDLDEALEKLLARRRVEVLAYRADGTAVLVLVGAGADLEHPALQPEEED